MELQSSLNIPYELFFERLVEYLNDSAYQITNYYGVQEKDHLLMICTIANSQTGQKQTLSYSLVDEPGILLASLSNYHPQAIEFETDISISLGIHFASIIDMREQRS